MPQARKAASSAADAARPALAAIPLTAALIVMTVLLIVAVLVWSGMPLESVVTVVAVGAGLGIWVVRELIAASRSGR
ncbi:hypothetical protein [Streptomyces parvulus]|uniref:hypothetical protein n=1 Tax=Streptomyces parvulus TaxID=146923 RepID=UPI001CFBE750|nr:hypothetical protein [Streptomyces parvulus]